MKNFLRKSIANTKAIRHETHHNMDLGLKNKVVLVTGGSRGIGKAIVLQLLAEGAHVAFTYNQNTAAAENFVASLKPSEGSIHPFQLDVKDPEACAQTVERVVEHYGSLYGLINNAGITKDGLLARLKGEDLFETFQTNLFGPIYLAKAACRPMMKAREGRILFLGSVVGQMGNTGQSVYAATKSGLSGLAKSLARELASRSITVNVLAPGFVDTDMTQDLSQETKSALLDMVPLGRMANASEIASSVVFLLAEQSSYITGQVIEINGGLHL